jgi:hypothetical protein
MQSRRRMKWCEHPEKRVLQPKVSGVGEDVEAFKSAYREAGKSNNGKFGSEHRMGEAVQGYPTALVKSHRTIMACPRLWNEEKAQLLPVSTVR